MCTGAHTHTHARVAWAVAQCGAIRGVLGTWTRARVVKIVRRYMGLSVGEMRCIFSFILNLNSKNYNCYNNSYNYKGYNLSLSPFILVFLRNSENSPELLSVGFQVLLNPGDGLLGTL